MPAPRLAGLSYEYLVAAMRAFAAEERTNNLDMPKFMQVLTESRTRRHGALSLRAVTG